MTMKAMAGLCLSTLLLAAGLGGANAQSVPETQAYRVAQYAVPPGGEVYVDEYGRRVIIDSYGRIVGVEQPRRYEPQRGVVIDGPPPPGVTVEGRVGDSPAVRYQDPYPQQQPASADPYANNGYGDPGRNQQPVTASPLPPPSGSVNASAQPADVAPFPEATASAELPGDLPAGGAELPAPGQSILQPEGRTINESDPAPRVVAPKGKNAKAEIAALQILLDRAGMSPGVIDGQMGGNVDKAVAAYQEKYGKALPTGDPKALAEELDVTGGPAITTYEITAEDTAGPYVASIPSDYAEKALLPSMAYERVSERLAERFHMDENYLVEINRGADFNRAGTLIKVAATGPNVSGEVTKIIADKGREQVRAYGADGSLIAAYPSTIGSSQTPSPSGIVQVDRIAFDPNYTYNPKINFKQGTNDKILTIPPGPNGPVGSIWIALSKPTYGIHGTPDPSKIGKTNSHGCVRLTNWDAGELARMVKPGVTVEFAE